MAHEINLPQLPKIIPNKDKPTIIQIDGCYPGYGITLANTLRRVLLSSLPGTAIIAFKIKGVSHEFSTVPHVMEDVIKIGLNLKKIRFAAKEKFFDKTAEASLKIKGETEVKAKDIKTPAGIDIINKDLHIATLTDKKADLDMDFFIASGYGYERAEDRQKEKLPIGTIALDAIYSPVLRISYQVEDMRIGERTDFNRIIMKIETDGSIDADDAFREAASILEKHFEQLGKIKKAKIDSQEKTTTKKQKTDTKKSKILPEKLEDLKLNVKLIKALEENGIKSVAGLIRKKEEDLKELKGIGEKSQTIIIRKLKKIGIVLK